MCRDHSWGVCNQLVLVISCEPVNVETERRNFSAIEVQCVYQCCYHNHKAFESFEGHILPSVKNIYTFFTKAEYVPICRQIEGSKLEEKHLSCIFFNSPLNQYLPFCGFLFKINVESAVLRQRQQNYLQKKRQ